MVPFLPLHRNRDYFLSSKDLGYEYSNLLDASRSSPHSVMLLVFVVTGTDYQSFQPFSPPFSDQRLVESMHPYLEELQDLWPWLLLTGVCGGVASAATAAALLVVRRRLPRLPVGRWKALLPERRPLLWERDGDKGNYQTAF